MWRNKKFLVIGVLAVVALVGTLGGVVMAQTSDKNTTTAQDIKTNLMDKVASIYQTNTGTAIDAQELEKAFEQAQKEIRTEARDEFLKKLVEEGKISQEQADQWKAWLDARPDIPALGNGGGMHRGGGFGLRMGNCLSNSVTTK